MAEIFTSKPAGGMGVAAVREEGDFLIQSRYQSYLSDESGLGPGTASILFLPNDEAQIAAFLREMNERRMPVTVSGGRTGIVGGAVPQGGSVLSLESMKRIVGIRWDNESQEWRMTVQPGITLRELQQRIATKNFEENTNESWKDLPRFLKDSNQYFYPPDPTEDLASLGGTVATDASGARTYFYGRTREHIRNIRVVLTNGEVIPLRRGEHQASRAEVIHVRHLDGTVTDIPLPKYERPKVKCATGFYNSTNMDLIDIFIGSEGTLGVITEIEIALQIKPKTAMFLAFFPSMEDATAFVIEERSKKKDKGPLSIHSMEYIDKNSLGLIHEIKEDHKLGIRLPESPTASILCEFGYADIEPAIQQLIESLSKFHSSADNAISGIDEGDKNRLKALRHAVPESINRMIAKRKKDIPGLHKLGTDTAVPDDKLLELMKLYNQKLIESRLEHYVVGHLAENHLHVNILPTSQEELIDGERLVRDLAKSAVALGGAVSAEHGIGKMKREFMMLMYSDAEVGEMIRLKRALDPNWILSRGNLFAPL